MKLFIFMVLAVMLVGMTAQAGEVPTSRGDKAMVFMFQGLNDLSLRGYDGEYGIGLRYYIADGTAIRGGIVLGIGSETDEQDEVEESSSSYGLEIIYERHMESPCASVSPFWGLGGEFSSVSEEEKNNVTDDEYRTSGTAFGVFGVAGFEWGFTDCITLGGEYRLGFLSESGKEEDNGDSADLYSANFTGFGAASVYLSVYW